MKKILKGIGALILTILAAILIAFSLFIFSRGNFPSTPNNANANSANYSLTQNALEQPSVFK